jgi:hypothetical protein
MSRTNNPAVSVYNSAITTYTNVNLAGTATITFNIALSSETSGQNLIGYLSGNPTVMTPFLSGQFGTTALSTLSIVPASPAVLTWPSIVSNNDFYAYVAASTFTPATSTWTATLEWNSLNFYTNTIFFLSGNSSALILAGGNIAQSLDNPFYSKTFTAPQNANENNSSIRTVQEHLRTWNLNG